MKICAFLVPVVLLAGCSKQETKGEAAPAAEQAPAGEQAPAAQEGPQTIFARSIWQAENVAKAAQQHAAEAADVLAERSREALDKLKELKREEVDPWLAEQQRYWGDTAKRLEEKAKARGNQAEPAVRQALESLRQARVAAEQKARELKAAAEADLPRLRRELGEAWRRVRSAEEEAEKTVDTTA